MSEPAAAPGKGHVLVIEDSVHTRNIFRHLFRQNGFEVTCFKNGSEAWQFMSTAKVENLRLVFSDVMMPTMTGIELVEHMRDSEAYKTVPVVLITAVTDRRVIEQAKTLNVKAYILKPVSATKIIDGLKKIFPDDQFIEIKVSG